MEIFTQRSAQNQAGSAKAEKSVDPRKLTDPQLYQQCKEYGGNARTWMRKFAGLLPEVYRRHLYKRRGFISIHEFAFKLAGMNYTAVDKVLNIAERLKDKPTLLGQLESGEEGWSKLQTVAYVAKPETDKEWAEKVHILPKPALEEYVREYRKTNGLENRLEFTPGSEFSDRTFLRFSVPISPENMKQLRLLKQKLEKERKQMMSWNEVMTELLKGGIVRTETGVASGNGTDGKTTASTVGGRKTTVIQICPECVKRKADEQEMVNPSRTIPADVKRIVEDRSRGVCEYPLCLRPASIFHHTRRYALQPNHDPGYVLHLCMVHNHLAHASLIKNEEKKPENWQLQKTPDKNSEKYEVDKLVSEHWRG